MNESLSPNEARIEKVVAALEDSRFEWRTLQGVAEQTKLSVDEVLASLSTLINRGIVIRSRIPAANGEDLYTTRTHFKDFSTVGDRIAAAFRNRAN
jgi:predicted transcriptional regulator